MNLFHVAPADAAKLIEQEGIRGNTDGWGDTVWAWDSLRAAREYAGSKDVIYKIDSSKYSAEPSNNLPSKSGGMSWGLLGPICPGDFGLVN